jgi:hypothetical protein
MNIVRWLRVQWDRGLAVAAALAGVIALIVSWVGISDQVFAARQLPYLLSGGIGGLFLLGVGATLWLSADLRDEWHKLDRIERRMEAGGAVIVPAARTETAGPATGTQAPTANAVSLGSAARS